ncbi:MAG: hypothetical protein WKF97_08325 [Chitinophagaceae bacterium]
MNSMTVTLSPCDQQTVTRIRSEIKRGFVNLTDIDRLLAKLDSEAPPPVRKSRRTDFTNRMKPF